jgi:hypothetical protein
MTKDHFPLTIVKAFIHREPGGLAWSGPDFPFIEGIDA